MSTSWQAGGGWINRSFANWTSGSGSNNYCSSWSMVLAKLPDEALTLCISFKSKFPSNKSGDCKLHHQKRAKCFTQPLISILTKQQSSEFTTLSVFFSLDLGCWKYLYLLQVASSTVFTILSANISVRLSIGECPGKRKCVFALDNEELLTVLMGCCWWRRRNRATIWPSKRDRDVSSSYLLPSSPSHPGEMLHLLQMTCKAVYSLLHLFSSKGHVWSCQVAAPRVTVHFYTIV